VAAVRGPVAAVPVAVAVTTSATPTAAGAAWPPDAGTTAAPTSPRWSTTLQSAPVAEVRYCDRSNALRVARRFPRYELHGFSSDALSVPYRCLVNTTF